MKCKYVISELSELRKKKKGEKEFISEKTAKISFLNSEYTSRIPFP